LSVTTIPSFDPSPFGSRDVIGYVTVG